MDVQQFTRAMVYYAGVQPRYAPAFKEPAVVKFWFQEFGSLEPARLKAVFDSLMRKLDRFPAVPDVRAELGVAEQSDGDAARNVAELIFMQLRGGRASTRSATVAAARDAAVGEIGVQVVRMAGGWLALSETVCDDVAGVHKAQWRELAALLIRKARAGTLDAAPTFPRLAGGTTSVAGLIEAAAAKTAF